jgi:hypothetical protein
MTRDDLLKIHAEICERGRMLMDKKNRDYAGKGGIEPFANFTRVESMGICSTEQGFLCRLTDKMSRLSSFIESGKMNVTNESFEDTIIDVINYMVLFYAYLQDKTDKTSISDYKPTQLVPQELLNEAVKKFNREYQMEIEKTINDNATMFGDVRLPTTIYK